MWLAVKCLSECRNCTAQVSWAAFSFSITPSQKGAEIFGMVRALAVNFVLTVAYLKLRLMSNPSVAATTSDPDIANSSGTLGVIAECED